MTRPLLVGESNPRGGGQAFALYPRPRGAAGDLLCHRILGMSEHEYMERFDRRNLLGPGARWSKTAAREAATRLLDGGWDRLILLGARVSAAFGHEFWPFHERVAWEGRVRMLMLPHPSGRSRLWSAPGAIWHARLAVRCLVPEAVMAEARP